MIKSETIKESNITYKDIEKFNNRNCITGGEDHLYEYLKQAFSRAKSIDIIVAFLMESGVRLLQNELKDAIDRNIPVRILTGNYLNITQPQALFLVKDIMGDKVDLRFYNVPNKSFHPKAYIFNYEDEEGDIFIGSSNISKSALTSGIEWNYRIERKLNESDFVYYVDTFEDLFLNESIIVDDEEMERYSASWKRPKLFLDLKKSEDCDEAEDKKVIQFPRPMGAQIEALYELKKSRLEGLDKAVVVAATGLGKTYISAFDSIDFKRVLFVAHREEILKQSESTFLTVRPDARTGFFNGECKDLDSEILFASVQTLGQAKYLNDEFFKKDEFDYIIIDEFHHAVSGNYKNIIEYFTPKFLLGLTATPERLDNKNVYALCDYNVVYEARLKSAIDKGWLVPFRYYGVFDETDYSKVDYKNGKYDDVQLEEALMIHKRAELILNHYKKYDSKSALGFCTSRKHAEYMAKYFCENGVKACATYSGELGKNALERKEAIRKLVCRNINVIFSVDMFNEGLDVPSIDLVMFLRPTESPTVFLQQLGRGLRRCESKKYLNVLDFIGNYKKANLIPFFLSGDFKNNKAATGKFYMPKEEEYPEECIVNFDFRIIDIFKRQAEEKAKIEDIIIEEYYRIKAELKARPTRLDMYTYMNNEVYVGMKNRRDLNIFNDYLGFLKKLDEINESEEIFIGTFAHEFIKEIEVTAMTKTYKMPLFLAFYNHGNMKLRVDEEDIYESFKNFYDKASNGIDMIRDKSTSDFKSWGKSEFISLSKRNPQKFLAKSSGEFFYEDDNYFCLNDKLYEFITNKAFVGNFKDAIDYRTRRFYKERLQDKENKFTDIQ